MSIKENIDLLNKQIPEEVSLVAVSKTKPIQDLEVAYLAGQRIFGENKIQEMTEKWEALPKDIQWHMIGHVQTNKVKYMAPYVSLIHGVDRIKVLKEINKQGAKNERIIPCLLQVHIAEEETKFGFSSDEIESLFRGHEYQDYPNTKIVGLMGMASNTSDLDKVRQEFKGLSQLYHRLNTQGAHLNTLSMGMSGDYMLAIEQGSNMVRIGSKIFGSRNN